MISVFTNYLTPIGVNCSDVKPSVIYDQLRNAYNQGVKGIIECTKVFATNELGETDYDIVYEIWRNEDLHQILLWVNKKITLRLGLADYRTIGVRMRIATGMLNKLVAEEKLSIRTAYRIHDCFVTTINGELSAINTEDLPFLGRLNA